MKKEYNEYLEFAKSIACKAGEIMLKYFSAKDISKYKGDKTIVTLADTEINSYLIERVKEKYPTHSVFGEEEKLNNNSNFIWVCDPVDGTAQYARGVPIATFSLALVIDGVSVIGVVLDPFTNSLYHAVKEQGAFKNNERMKVSDIGLDDKRSVSSFDLCFASHPYASVMFPALWELMEKYYFVSVGSCVRGCVAVADGQYNLHLFPGCGCHDIAAVKIIVEEAGGVVRNLYGQEDKMDGNIKGAIVCNKVTYNEVFELLKKHIKDKKL